MACNSSGCDSNCYKDCDDKETTSISKPPPSSVAYLCVKCKTNPPISSGSTGDDGRFCADCFRSNLYGKFRLAVTSHAMITPSDNCLVAFSGGPSSRVVLQFVHEMQERAQKNFDASKDRSLCVFGVGVAFVDESSVNAIPDTKIKEVIEEMKSSVSNLSPPTKQFHVAPIESVYDLDLSDGKEKLRNLIDSIGDSTGKEDLVTHLRMLALQKIASLNGYNRIVLGSCTSRIACHVLAATVKGQGYSLSADIQYVDARWEVPVVLPLRDCTAQELNLLCHLDGLKTIELGNSSGINSLVSSFVNLLLKENPSREFTIARTAGKLTPFHFNRIPEINDSSVPLATRRRQKRYNLETRESISSEIFCPICYSPINHGSSNQESFENSDNVGVWCTSCQFQILPGDPSLMENFYSLLPHDLISRAKDKRSDNLSLLREQIEDCLLSDGEGET